MPQAEELFRGAPADDPAARLERVDTALHDMILTHEGPLRLMLVSSLRRGMEGEADKGVPPRQNRRTPLIEAALAPARHQFKPGAMKSLASALALVIGTEAMVVFKDVLQLDDAESRKVKRWAIRALVDAALRPPRAKLPDVVHAGKSSRART